MEMSKTYISIQMCAFIIEDHLGEENMKIIIT
jgi:hypothetical protein